MEEASAENLTARATIQRLRGELEIYKARASAGGAFTGSSLTDGKACTAREDLAPRNSVKRQPPEQHDNLVRSREADEAHDTEPVAKAEESDDADDSTGLQSLLAAEEPSLQGQEEHQGLRRSQEESRCLRFPFQSPLLPSHLPFPHQNVQQKSPTLHSLRGDLDSLASVLEVKKERLTSHPADASTMGSRDMSEEHERQDVVQGMLGAAGREQRASAPKLTEASPGPLRIDGSDRAGGDGVKVITAYEVRKTKRKWSLLHADGKLGLAHMRHLQKQQQLPPQQLPRQVRRLGRKQMWKEAAPKAITQSGVAISLERAKVCLEKMMGSRSIEHRGAVVPDRLACSSD